MTRTRKGLLSVLLAAITAVATSNIAATQETGAATPAEGPVGTEVVVTGNLIGCYGGPGEITSYYGFPKRVVYYWNPQATTYTEGQSISDRLSANPNDKSGLTEVASYSFGEAGWELKFNVPADATPGYHFNVISFEPRCQRFYRDENGKEVEEDQNAYNVVTNFCVMDSTGVCPSTPGDSTSPSAATVPSASPSEGGKACTIRGVVKDHRGGPIGGVHVQLNGPGIQIDSQTAANGEYRFENWVPAGSTLDPASEDVKVSMLLEEFPVGRYQFFYRSDVPQLDTLPFKPEGETCRKDIDFAAAGAAQPTTAGEWRDLWAMYRQFMSALTFAETELGQPLDYGLPLKVVTWCEAAQHSSCNGNPGAFYDGTAFGYSTVARPGIYIETRDSPNKGTRLDDTMYHEFGHALLADAFDDSYPSVADRAPHKGYYVNTSSNDAWIEGWASFFALMVSQRAEGRLPRFRYHDKTELDLEVNLKAWDANGKHEEFAITGALLDLVDGASDYASLNPGPVAADDVKYVTLRTAGGASVIVGKIARLSKGSLARLFVEFVRGGKQVGARSVWVSGDDEDLRLGTGVAFWVPVPKSIRYDSIRITGLKNAELDDDPVDLEFSEVWDSIGGGTPTRSGGNKPAGYGRVFDAADLYEVLSDDFGGEDADEDGVDDIDQIFIAHGLHADNGNKVYDTGERIGLTSHPALNAAGAPTGDAVLRYNSTIIPEAQADVTANVSAAVIAFVDDPAQPERGYSYVAGNTDAPVTVWVPEAEGTSVTLMALADGHLPEVIGTVESESFWEEAHATPDTSFLSFDVTLQEGEVDLGSNGGPGPLLLLGGGVLLLAAAYLLFRAKRTVSGP